MSTVNFKDGKFFLLQDGGKVEILLDAKSSAANLSRFPTQKLLENHLIEYPLSKTVSEHAKKIFSKTPESLVELVIYLRIVARLMRKPQIHNVLKIGAWTPLSEALTEILPKFNPANKFYCLSETRPLGKISSVVFLFVEGGEYPLPENKFDTIIFPKPAPPPEILLAVRDSGKIYFSATPPELEEFFKPHTNLFALNKNLVLFETEISPLFRKEIFKRTPQGKLNVQKIFIGKVISKFSYVKKFSQLDEYISEVTRAEKILAEIFPLLHSGTIKFNLNLFKECLIDTRLALDSDSKKIAATRALTQYKILIRDWNNS